MEWTAGHSELAGKALIAAGVVLLMCVALWLEFRDLSGPGPSFPTSFQRST